MDNLEPGRQVRARVKIFNRVAGEPDIQPGTLGRVLRHEAGGDLFCVRWQVEGRARPIDVYANVSEIDVVLVEP